jgi:hypothetical protein
MGAAGRYTGDIYENRADGKAGVEAFLPRSSPAQYVAAAGTGAAASVATAYSMGLAAILSAGGYALDNKMAGKPFNLKNALTVGLLSYLGGSFFEWGVGDVPMSLLMKKNIVGGVFDMSSQAVLQNMLLTNSALNLSGGQATAGTMPSVIYQNGVAYYRNSSGLLTTTPPTQSTQPPSSGGGGGVTDHLGLYTRITCRQMHTRLVVHYVDN